MKLKDLVVEGASRRDFLLRMGASGLGVLALRYLGGCASTTDKMGRHIPQPTKLPGIPGKDTTVAVLNYALSLECLEADLYRQAVNHAVGKDSQTPLQSHATSYVRSAGNGGLSGAAAEAGFKYLVEFANVEAAHRDFLRMAIQSSGGTPVKPNRRGYRFPGGIPGDMRGIMIALLQVEEVGQRAYLGATPLIDDLTLLQTAATIHSTEAAHAATFADLLNIEPGPRRMKGDKQVFPVQFSDDELEFFQDPPEILQLVAPYIVGSPA